MYRIYAQSKVNIIAFSHNSQDSHCGTFLNTYWTPKETLQSGLLHYFIKCDYVAFLHLVKVVRDVFEYKC